MASDNAPAWRRRSVLGGLAGIGLARPSWAALPHPGFKVPDGACDCHHHMYDRRWPYAATAVLRPPPATVADYRRYQRQLGTSRDIVVTPSTYGFNNDCTLDALAQLGRNARGVAVVPVDVDAASLKRLHAGGVRGVRIQSGAGNLLGVDAILPLARRIAPLGWHLQLNLTAPQYVEQQALLLKLPAVLVIDHMAQIPGQEGVKSAAYATLRRLLDSGRAWVKVSSPDTLSQSGPPDYADKSAIARALIAAAPERCVWGSNWPFPSSNPKPDAVLMLDLLGRWAPDAKLRHRILVENPERLYGFDPAHRPAAPI
jgi:D-galactarolactone isomerase